MLQIQSIDGVAVEVQQPAWGPHPHPDFAGQMFVYNGVLHVQLADGREGYIGEVCVAENCPKLWDSCKSAAAHLSFHNGKERGSTIPVETLKALLRIAKRFQNAGHRDYAQRTANEMNRLGIKSIDGEPWNSLRVGRLFNKWQDKVAAPLPPSRMTTPAPDVKIKDVVPTQRTNGTKSLPATRRQQEATSENPLVRRLLEMSERHQDMATDFEQLAGDIAAELAKGKVDPELVRKAMEYDEAVKTGVFERAAKFDAARNLFGN